MTELPSSTTVGPQTPSKSTSIQSGPDSFLTLSFSKKSLAIRSYSVVENLSTQSLLEIQDRVWLLAELLGLGSPIVSETDGHKELIWSLKK